MRQVGRLNGPYYARLQRSWKTFRGGISPWPGCRRLRVISMLLLGPAVRGKTVRSKSFERKRKKERKRDRTQLERNRADWHARSTRDLRRSIGFEKKKKTREIAWTRKKIRAKTDMYFRKKWYIKGEKESESFLFAFSLFLSPSIKSVSLKLNNFPLNHHKLILGQ